ncbi:hypothetical protein H2203_006029 [Taxawa tesnikishii (nom. ined.)]|nr:hypothetical protein H2203_006029 [Dothideales sp. JES 119]
MAISDALPGVEVAVTVNGNDLKEYEDPEIDAESRTVTRYIEAVSDQRFGIRIKIPKGFEYRGDCLAFRITIDGIKTGGPGFGKHKTESGDFHTTRMGKPTGVNEIQPYTFAALEFAASGHATESLRNITELGVIKISVEHGVYRGADEPGKSIEKAIEVLSEKALKGRTLSHVVKFGEAEKSQRHNWVRTKKIEQPTTFTFKYRSEAALKSLMIIPRTPSPIPLEERDPETLSREEMLELLRKQKEELDRLKGTKREPQDDTPRARKKTRATIGSTQLELDENGDFRKSRSATPAVKLEKEVTEIDSD